MGWRTFLGQTWLGSPWCGIQCWLGVKASYLPTYLTWKMWTVKESHQFKQESGHGQGAGSQHRVGGRWKPRHSQSQKQTEKTYLDKKTGKQLGGWGTYLSPPLVVGHFKEGDRRESLNIAESHTWGVQGTHDVNPPETHQSRLENFPIPGSGSKHTVADPSFLKSLSFFFQT